MEQKKWYETTSASLHIVAMACMLCDHLWATVVPGNDWLTCLGRVAFPVFAFMIVEGYFHTGDLEKYVKRLLVAALLSEIPFNFMAAGTLFYPLHQNVLFSFLISIWLIWLNERAAARGGAARRALVGALTIGLAVVLGVVTFVDYYHAGILTVLLFYAFRGRKWWHKAGQFVGLWYINTQLLGGFGWGINILGQEVFLSRQSFALFALIPIWLYRGRQGHRSRVFRNVCYAFYPVHMVVLSLIALLS